MSFIKRVLVSTDFSDNATQAYAYLRELSTHFNFKVDMIHVIPKMTYLELSEEVRGNAIKIQKNYKLLRKNLIERMETDLTHNFPKSFHGDVFVKDGIRISRGIVEQSQERDYDLILIGSRSEDEMVFRKGSVTERLIRISNIPVMSFTKAFSEPIKKIMLPTDGSMASFEALPYALELADALAINLTLYSVMDFDAHKIALLGGNPQIEDYVVKGLQNQILENLESTLNKTEDFKLLDNAALENIQIEDKKGKTIDVEFVMDKNISAHQSIVRYANENTDLVVMTTHGRSGLSKVLIGSVAEKVVRHLNVPVITLKPEFAKK